MSVEVDDFNREIELTRQNKELMALLDQRGKQTKTIPLDEAKATLGLWRSLAAHEGHTR